MENQRVGIGFNWHKPSKSRNTIIVIRDPKPYEATITGRDDDEIFIIIGNNQTQQT